MNKKIKYSILIFFIMSSAMIFADNKIEGIWKSIDPEWEEFLFFESDGSGMWRMPMDLDGTFFSWKTSGTQVLVLRFSPQDQIEYEYMITKTGLLIVYLDAADGPVITVYSRQK